jgi:hypothetical protein
MVKSNSIGAFDPSGKTGVVTYFDVVGANPFEFPVYPNGLHFFVPVQARRAPNIQYDKQLARYLDHHPPRFQAKMHPKMIRHDLVDEALGSCDHLNHHPGNGRFPEGFSPD